MNSPISPAKLKTIATHQKIHTIGIVLSLVGIALLGYSSGAAAGLVKDITYLTVGAMLIHTLVLAWNVYGMFGFLVSCFVTLIPGINVLLWFIVNTKCTRTLRSAGVKVGTFGAETATLPSERAGPPILNLWR